MRDFEHKHVLSLKGIVEIKGNFCLVFKWMENGALNSYVKKNKSSISFRQLLSFCRDIADGMAYLAQRNVFHRDLAARNCLVTLDSKERYLVKVADFGLSRLIETTSEVYTAKKGGKFPIKWTAPEAIAYNRFSVKSDVWSFGVLFWEGYWAKMHFQV